jgi:hypothetical protein
MKKRILKPEEKELLIKDLLPRIPTGLFVDVPDEEEPKKLEKIVRWKIVYGRARSLEDCLDGLIPYLRPLSSITEKEFQELHSICPHSAFNKTNVPGWIIGIDGSDYGRISRIDEISKLLDWLVSHHFDFRGLIQAGLALEAKEGMYDD